MNLPDSDLWPDCSCKKLTRGGPRQSSKPILLLLYKDRLLFLYRPNDEFFIVSSRCQQLSLGGKRKSPYRASMSLKTSDSINAMQAKGILYLPCTYTPIVPKMHYSVIASSGKHSYG